jgi:putative ABC transport system permease protein
MARRFWPDQNPLGKYIVQGDYPLRGESKPTVRQIVGVVGNVKHFLRYFTSDDFVKSFTSFPDDVVYVPGYQNALMIRTEGNPKHLLTAIRKEFQAMDNNIVLCDISTVEEEISTLFSPQRFNMFFLGAFAVLALILTSIGIYGTVAYAVSRRTHELGIRMALGARGVEVLKTILKQGIKLVLMGIILGLAGALALTRVVSSLLHDVSPTDPLTFMCVSFILAGAALAACYIPARRAARIDPMKALRYE